MEIGINEQKEKLRKTKLRHGIFSLLSAIFQQFGLAALAVISELHPYFTSFLHESDKSLTIKDDFLLFPVYNTALWSSIFMGGILEIIFKPVKSVNLTLIVYAVCGVLFYISNHIAAIYTLFFVLGFGVGMAEQVTIKNACLYFPKNRGLLTTIIPTTGTLLAAGFSALAEKVIVNPNGKPAHENGIYDYDVAKNVINYVIIAVVIATIFIAVCITFLIPYEEENYIVVDENVENPPAIEGATLQEKEEKVRDSERPSAPEKPSESERSSDANYFDMQESNPQKPKAEENVLKVENEIRTSNPMAPTNNIVSLPPSYFRTFYAQNGPAYSQLFRISGANLSQNDFRLTGANFDFGRASRLARLVIQPSQKEVRERMSEAVFATVNRRSIAPKFPKKDELLEKEEQREPLRGPSMAEFKGEVYEGNPEEMKGYVTLALRSWRFWKIWLINFCSCFVVTLGTVVFKPLGTQYGFAESDLQALLIGRLVVCAIFTPISGIISDRIKFKYIMLLISIGAVIFGVLVIFAKNIWFYTVVIYFDYFLSGFIEAYPQHIMVVFGMKYFIQIFGVFCFSGVGAFLFSSLLAFILTEYASNIVGALQISFIVGAALSVVAVIMAFFETDDKYIPEKYFYDVYDPDKGTEKDKKKSKKI